MGSLFRAPKIPAPPPIPDPPEPDFSYEEYARKKHQSGVGNPKP